MEESLSCGFGRVYPFRPGAGEEREYSILSVMSELSTVRCDRAFGLWIAGTRASNVDGELRGGARAGRQLWRLFLDRGRKRRRKAGFLVCATKPSRRTAVEDAKSWRHGRRFRD